MLLPILNKLGLWVNQPYLIVPLAVGGLFTQERRAYSQAILLVTFTTIYNAYLKSIWRIPLPHPLKGWAFPSGHMHSAVIFWGFLAYHYQKPWFSALVGGMLALSGFGLVYSGYHYFIDVVAAVGFGALTLTLHALGQKIPAIQEKPSREGFLLSLLGILFTALMPPVARRAHVWQALSTVMGYTVSWFAYEQYQKYQAKATIKTLPAIAPSAPEKNKSPSKTSTPGKEKKPLAIVNHYQLRQTKQRIARQTAQASNDKNCSVIQHVRQR